MAAATRRMVISPSCCSAPSVSPVWPPICVRQRYQKRGEDQGEAERGGGRAARPKRQQRRKAEQGGSHGGSG